MTRCDKVSQNVKKIGSAGGKDSRARTQGGGGSMSHDDDSSIVTAVCLYSFWPLGMNFPRVSFKFLRLYSRVTSAFYRN